MRQDVGAAKSERIALRLAKDIKTGAIGRGDRLDSETALMKRFSVSRNTIRKSLEILSRDGLIVKRNGIGSFATYGGKVIDNEAGWTLALSSGATKIGTRVLALRRETSIRGDIPIAPGTDCLFVERLRFRVSDGLGISLERSRVPWRDRLAGIPEHGLLDGSLNKSLRACGLVVASGEEWANVLTALPAEDAAIMGRRHGEPMLLLRRLTRSGDGAIIEYVDSTLDPDSFGLHLEF